MPAVFARLTLHEAPACLRAPLSLPEPRPLRAPPRGFTSARAPGGRRPGCVLPRSPAAPAPTEGASRTKPGSQTKRARPGEDPSRGADRWAGEGGRWGAQRHLPTLPPSDHRGHLPTQVAGAHLPRPAQTPAPAPSLPLQGAASQAPPSHHTCPDTGPLRAHGLASSMTWGQQVQPPWELGHSQALRSPCPHPPRSAPGSSGHSHRGRLTLRYLQAVALLETAPERWG